MQWWNSNPSDEGLCFSLPLYPPGRPLVTADATPCFPVLDQVLELIIYVLGCVANLAAISLIVRGGKRSQTGGGGESIPRLLVLALCATELTFLVLGETGWLVSFLAGAWTGDFPVYFFSVFVVVACNRLSKCIVVLMGIERYLSIKKPFFYENSVTLRRIGLAILAMILYSMFMAGFFVAGVTTRTWGVCPGGASAVAALGCVATPGQDPPTNLTTFTFVFSSVENAYEYFTSLESAGMTGVLIACNIVVIRCMQKLKAHLEVTCPRNREEYVKQMDMIRGAPADFSRLMVAIALVFVICILPYEIRWFANHLNAWHSPSLDYIAVRLYLSTCLINPLVYGVFRRKVRRKIMERTVKLLGHWCCCCGKRKNRVRPKEAGVGQWQLQSTVSASVESGGGPC